LGRLPALDGARFFLTDFFSAALTVFDVPLVLVVALFARDGFLLFAPGRVAVFFFVTLFFGAAGFVFLFVSGSTEMSLSIKASCATVR
jgi:hypothetical protein